jgi:phosphohistidine phosphatase
MAMIQSAPTPTLGSVATVELLLLRHGIAEARGGAVPEAARALTARGRERSGAVLRCLTERGLRAGRLISSPLRRARETAELAVAAGLAPALELAEALAPGGAALAALPTWLETLEAPPGEWPRLVLVGHEPDLSLLAARLIGAPPGSLALRKAGLALLRLPRSAAPGEASLRLLLSPRLLIG